MDGNVQSHTGGSDDSEDKHSIPKKAILAGAVVVAAAGVGTALLAANKLGIKGLPNPASIKHAKATALKAVKEVSKSPSPDIRATAAEACREVNVGQHLRTLPDGWKASAEAIERAKSLGVDLGAKQTIVSAYTKTYHPAA